MSRYERPHKCNHPDCGNRKGFVTDNDFDRHQVSVHGQPSRKGKNRVWICAYPNCHQDKEWTRVDNFRTHIKKVHHVNDVEQREDWIRQFVTIPILLNDVTEELNLDP